MQNKLRLPKIPQVNDLYSQALAKIDPELDKIHKTLINGLPKEEFKKLVKKQEEIIKFKYGSSNELNNIIDNEINNIPRNII